MAERGPRAARPYDSLLAGVSTACTSIAICGQGLSRSPSSCSSPAGPGAAIRAAALTLSGSGSRAATPRHAGPCPCSPTAASGTPAAAAAPLHSSSRAATPRRAILDSPYLCSPTAKSATHAATAVLLLHSSSSGSRSAALSPLHTGSRPLLPGGHFLPAMPHPHSPSAVQLSGQGSPSAAAAWRRPTSAVLPFRCPQEDRMGQGGETVAGTGTSEATHPHQTPPHQLPASSACAARLNPLLAPLRPPSQRSRSSVGSGTASPCPITRVGGGSGTSVSGILDCERNSVGRSSLLSCGSSRAHKSGTSVGGSLDCGGCSCGSRSLLSGGSTRICDNSANGGGCLECGGGSVITSSLLSYGSILLSGGSSSTRSLASHSPGSSHSSDASLRFASSPPVNTPLRYSTSPPVDALPHAAPPLLPCTQPETPPIDVVSGDAHAPAAAVGEIGAVGAAVAAAAAVGAKATNAGEAEVKATAADTAAGGSGQSSGRWTQLEAALTTAPPPAPWQSTLSQPQAARTHVPFACMHSPPGSPSLGLAQSQAELVYAQKPGQQQPLSQQQQQQQQQRQQQRQQQWQQQRQQPQAQHCTLCEQQCEGPQGQAKCGSSRGSSAGASRGCPEASCCSGASWSIEASGVLLANGATAGPAAVDTDLSSAAGDAGNQTPPVVANAAEGRLQQQPQVSEEQGGKGQTQPGITEGQSQPGITEGQSQPGITEGQSQPRPGVGEEGNTEPATLTKQQPQRRPEDGELGALEPQADEAGERSDAEAEGRVVEVEKGEEEVDGAVGRKKKRKAKGGKRALKASGSNTSNGSAGSTACGGPSNSSSRCGGSHGSIVSGGAGDVASGVGCGSRGSNVLRGVGDGSRGSHVSRGLGDGSRGSSRGSSGPAVADTQDGRNGCASTCSSGSGSARAGDSGKCATVPLQGPPNGPLSSNTGGPISIVGQGPSANLANPIGRASPSPGVVRGRSMSTGRGCGALQRTARLDGTSDTLRHRSGGASSSLHCSPPRTSRRSGAFNTMPLPPLAATQLPSRGFQDHSAFHTCVASVNSRFGPGEALVPRSGGSSGGRGSVAGVMGQAEGEAAGREVLDLREERRKAHERLEAYSKAKQAKAQEAAMEDANRRRAIQDARNAHKAAKERQREEVYALNAILRMSEQAFINQLLEAAARSVRRMSKDGHSQLEAAAEHAAAAAAAAASAGGAAVGHAAAAVVGAASARGTVAEYAAHAAATAAAADSAREPGAQSPEGSFSSSVHDSSSSVRQAAGASDAVVLGVGGVRGVESVGGSGGRSRPVSALVVLVAAAVSQPQSALGRALRAHPALPGSGVASGTTSIAAGAGGSTGGSTGRVTAGTADTVGIKAGAAAGPARGLVPGRNVAGAGGALDGDDVDDGFIAEDGEGSDEEQADVSLMQSILSRMAHGV